MNLWQTHKSHLSAVAMYKSSPCSQEWQYSTWIETMLARQIQLHTSVALTEGHTKLS